MSGSAPRRQLTLFDSVCIITGIVIGAGIYETTTEVAGAVAGPWGLMWVWVAGGLISLAGAMCYVELATAYPREGGDYVYLTRAYGRRTGFVFAWTEYWIVRPGNVGMMAFVFARFAYELLQGTRFSSGDADRDFVIYAVGTIVVITGLNLLGVRTGKATQNALTALKVIGLVTVCLAALLTPAAHVTSSAPRSPANYGLALMFVLFTFGGWNDICYVAAEVRQPRQNILRSLMWGVGLVTAVYLLVNYAFLHALGFEGVGRYNAGDLLQLRFGDTGRRAISGLICVSCLGAINGTLFAGSRIYYAVGTEHRLVAWLGRWSGQFDSPVRALLLQGATSLAWVVAFGVGNGADGFRLLLAFTSPVFWFFTILISLSVFVLRWKEPNVERPHKIVLFPLTPIVFCGSSLFMFYCAVDWARFNWQQQWEEIGWSPLALATGLVVVAGIAITLFDSAGPADFDDRSTGENSDK